MVCRPPRKGPLLGHCLGNQQSSKTSRSSVITEVPYITRRLCVKILQFPFRYINQQIKETPSFSFSLRKMLCGPACKPTVPMVITYFLRFVKGISLPLHQTIIGLESRSQWPRLSRTCIDGDSSERLPRAAVLSGIVQAPGMMFFVLKVYCAGVMLSPWWTPCSQQIAGPHPSGRAHILLTPVIWHLYLVS